VAPFPPCRGRARSPLLSRRVDVSHAFVPLTALESAVVCHAALVPSDGGVLESAHVLGTQDERK